MSKVIPAMRAIIVDPRPIFRDVLQACLTKVGCMVVGQFSNLEETRQQVEMLEPDLMILGPHLAESGLVVCRVITCHLPTLKTILFTAHADDLLFQVDACHAGVTVLLRPESTKEECLAVIAQVMAGQSFFSQEFLALVSRPIDLTAREREVLRLMAERKTNREIADALGLKGTTVRNHAQRILEKLGVHSRQEAIWRAKHRGLV